MRPKKFLFSALAGVPAFCLLYFLAVDWLLVFPSPLIPSYRFFLADALGEFSSRMFIVSGSNGLHGIDALALEQTFGRPAASLTDNAGYPLSHKLDFLEPRLKPGDIMLLPLEWDHYLHEDNSFPLELVEHLLDNDSDMGFYYHGRTLLQRLQHVFREFPLRYVLRQGARLPKRLISTSQRSLGYLNSHAAALDSNDAGKRATFAGPHSLALAPALIPSNRLPCDATVLALQRRLGFFTSSTFHADMARLARMRDRGVHVFLTWPAVVARTPEDQCYGPAVKEQFAAYVESLRREVAGFGFNYLGAPEEFRYGSDCFLNTHFHITPECARDNTARIIDLLRQAGVTPTGQQVTAAVDESVRRQISERAAVLLPELDARAGSGLHGSALLLSGWYPPEPWGAWSSGLRSTTIFKLPAGGPFTLRIQGSYFQEPEDTEIYLDGERITAMPVDNATLRIDGVRAGPRLAELTLVHKRSVVPGEVTPGGAVDARSVRFGLQALKVMPSDQVYADLRPLGDERDGQPLQARVVLEGGWYQPEEWGVWSAGWRSSLTVKLPAGGPVELGIRGRYFNGAENTEILMNGNSIGALSLEDVRLRVHNERAEAQTVELTLIHKHPAKPQLLDPHSADTRLIKYGLQEIWARPL